MSIQLQYGLSGVNKLRLLRCICRPSSASRQTARAWRPQAIFSDDIAPQRAAAALHRNIPFPSQHHISLRRFIPRAQH